MKKFYSLLVVVVLLLAVSSMTFAVAGNISNSGNGLSSTYTITAAVDPYAEIVWGAYNPAPALSGAANVDSTGTLAFTIASNCAVDLTMSATPMTTNLAVEDGHAASDTTTIPTVYALTTTGAPVYQAAPIVWGSALDQELKAFTLYYKVSDGAQIYSQHAGDYTATVTLTVVSQAY